MPKDYRKPTNAPGTQGAMGLVKRPRSTKLYAVWEAHERILIGWEEISKYLGRGIATCKRYAESYGLPVAYLPDKMRITSTSLIDSWILALYQSQNVAKVKPDPEEPQEPTW